VPRWLSLKSNEVMARRGPGLDYPALFTYRARGLPVQVVAETAEWRRVCVPEGGAVWVHKSMVDGRRMVMSPVGAPTPLLARPQAGAREAALMSPSALAALERCEHGWCRVSAGGRSGWVPQARLWGTAAQPMCR
jgi:SH3-like domain-containing protein